MLDIFWVLLICAAYFVAGYLYAIRKLQKEAQNIMQGIIDRQERKEAIQRIALALNHEVIDGVHYFYKHNDNTFVCQGTSLEEAAVAYSARETQKMGVFRHSSDKQLYAFFDGKVVRDNDDTITFAV